MFSPNMLKTFQTCPPSTPLHTGEGAVVGELANRTNAGEGEIYV